MEAACSQSVATPSTCAADAHSYALLDVVAPAKDRPCSQSPHSTHKPATWAELPKASPAVSHAPSRSVSSVTTGALRGQDEAHHHSRSTSLNMLGLGGPPSGEDQSPPSERRGTDLMSLKLFPGTCRLPQSFRTIANPKGSRLTRETIHPDTAGESTTN